MEYDVIGGHTLDDLRYDVNQAVKRDGDLKVGYAFGPKTLSHWWAQAMVRENQVEPLSIITPTGFLRAWNGVRRSIRPL